MGTSSKKQGECSKTNLTDFPGEDKINMNRKSKPKDFETERSNEEIFGDDKCPLDVDLTAECTNSTIPMPTKNSVLRYSIKGKKRSLANLPIDGSPFIPMNDDRSELEVQVEKEQQESIVKRDNNHGNVFKNSLTANEMEEHISQCIALNFENKINSKNAFRLQLIDFMTIMAKDVQENNFAAMACQLDAGVKIYSHRVDAVHHQVMKLMDSCILAEQGSTKQTSETESKIKDDTSKETQEYVSYNGIKNRKRKKKILVTNDQISQKLKEDNPRDRFVPLKSLPGNIMNKTQRDPKDLSLTLEKNTPFWLNVQDYAPTKATSEYFIEDIEINESETPLERLDETISFNCVLPSTSEINPLSSVVSGFDNVECQENDESETEDCKDEDDEKDFEELIENFQSNDIETEFDGDPDIVCIARSRMMREGCLNELSRVDVINAIFHKPGESDYHYLRMDNAKYWAGPSFWKRPRGVNMAANKKKGIRKKKEPLVIDFKNIKSVNFVNKKEAATCAKRNVVLSKKTMLNWSKRKTTLPINIDFQPDTFIKLFHIETMVDDGSLNKTNQEEQNYIQPFETRVTNDDEVDDDYELEGMASSLDSSDLKDNSVSGLYEENQEVKSELKNGYKECLEESGTSKSTEFSSQSTSCDVYEGDNLVPMVKVVNVEPIRCVIKPNRVDMHHLKEVMKNIIWRHILEKENQLQSGGEDSSRGSIAFKVLLIELFKSDELNRRTRKDLTVQMAFLALLTLANEYALLLEKDESDDVIVRRSNSSYE